MTKEMNYKIGDIVIRKYAEKKSYADKWTFLGTTESGEVKPVTITKSVMGGDVQIGMFVHKPIEIVYNGDNDNYVVELSFYNVELFEKDE